MRCIVPLVIMGYLVFGDSPAFAHPHHEAHQHVAGFEAGFTHPLMGLDHLLAMLTVGVVAARSGRRAIWLVPATFVACMAAGGIAGIFGSPLWGVEQGIALSVLLLGVAVAAGRRLPSAVVLASCGVFGFFHGHAHGAEMPSLAQPVLYALGFVLATVLLHAAGIIIARTAARTAPRQTALRLSGAAMAIVGAALLMGV